jgi:hypothetical protein
MIALQARNPQLPDPSRQTAQFANMMNMARQQEAAQRQSALAQQTMDINQQENVRAGETQASNMRKADLDYRITNMKRLRNLGVVVMQTEDPTAREAAYQSLVGMIGDADEQFGATLRQVAPTFNAQVLQALIMEADKFTDKTVPNVEASKEYAAAGARDAQGNPIPEGTVIDTRVGGLPGAAGSTPLRASGANTPAPRATPTAPQSNPFAADAPPANTAAENVNSLGLVIASARETGVMAQSDVDKLLSAAAPGSAPKLMAWLSQNNIQVAPDAPGVTDNQMRGAAADLPSEMRATPMVYDGQTPESQFADLRGPAPQSQTAGLRGAPPMEQTLAQYIPVQRRDPNVSPYPASAQVPLGRVAAEAQAGRIKPAEAAANARATKQVDIEMAPQLATATKTAERTAQLKAEAPKARNATLSIIADIDDRINTIDEFLRSPNRHLINGPIEGNLPRLLQTGARADAQAAFDKIKNTATLTSLIDLRKSTETGASPVGANPTDRDARIVEQAASKLIQTGELPKMDAELIAMRQKLYRTRVSAVDGYAAEYGDVIASDPRLRLNAPAIADRYIRTTGSGKKGTSTKVDRNNPLLRGM